MYEYILLDDYVSNKWKLWVIKKDGTKYSPSLK